ncbi:scavenger receptor class B member 1-like [Cotesia glomerata]|uniref:Scavenger receptor class B member 1 n=1 Tax=Cotesia glomerata TaxID=32391 RepID=A0AAV7IFP6_COTGL|nr:scavenger receptor class B member 1-like [Cotesia glomerata]KAH0550026.1 hypothetical protein KQX54_016936 [Cotesia glomerata]
MTQGLSVMEKPLSLSSTSRRHLHPRKIIIASFFGVTVSSLLLFIIFWCTNLFQNTILSSLVVKNGSPMLEWFIRPPIRAVYKIRIFNYTNVIDYQRGKAKKLKVQETGPYIYRETLTRVNYTFNSDGSINFKEKRSYQWEGGSPDDEIVTVPNVPLLASMATMRDTPFFAQLAFTGLLSTLQSNTFLSLPVNGLLWGYDDKIFEFVKPFISHNNIPFDKFGLLAFKNGISPDVITMNSGINDLSEYSMIQSINGKKHTKIWNDKKCDKIYGTQGYTFPLKMFQGPNKTLEVYSGEMCRTLYLRNVGTGSSFGIPSLTFKPVEDIFDYSSGNNRCYCPESTPGVESSRICPPNGLFNSSACLFNMPFLTSFPHFYSGDKILQNNVDGLNPQAELHESHVELHPRLGVLIGGASRIQLNIEARRAVGVPFHGGLDDGQILPLLWIELTIDDISEPLLSSLKRGYYTVAAVETGIQWGSIIAFILSTCGLMHVWRKQKKESASRTINLSNSPQDSAKPHDESELASVKISS